MTNLFSFNYYVDLLIGNKKARTLLLVLILTLLLSIKPSYFFITNLYPKIQNFQKQIDTLIDKLFPEKLEIKIKDGYATSNMTEPYFINIKKETLESLLTLEPENQKSSSTIRLLTIDTNAKNEDFEKYQSLALLTKTELIYYQDSKINSRSLASIKDLTINKSFVKSQADRFTKNQIMTTLLDLGPFIIPLFIFIGLLLIQLLTLLLTSLAVLLVARIKQIPYGFKAVFDFTGAIFFLVSIIWFIFELIPDPIGAYFASSYIPALIILGFAYHILNLSTKSQPPPEPVNLQNNSSVAGITAMPNSILPSSQNSGQLNRS